MLDYCSWFELFLSRKQDFNHLSYPINTGFPWEDYYKHYSNDLSFKV